MVEYYPKCSGRAGGVQREHSAAHGPEPTEQGSVHSACSQIERIRSLPVETPAKAGLHTDTFVMATARFVVSAVKYTAVLDAQVTTVATGESQHSCSLRVQLAT